MVMCAVQERVHLLVYIVAIHRPNNSSIIPSETQHNAYLERFNIADNAIFPGCRDTKEMVKRYLLVCKKYKRWRDRMRKAVGVGCMKMEILFGDARRTKDAIEWIEWTE
jgi:hypothetical protein